MASFFLCSLSLTPPSKIPSTNGYPYFGYKSKMNSRVIGIKIVSNVNFFMHAHGHNSPYIITQNERSANRHCVMDSFAAVNHDHV